MKRYLHQNGKLQLRKGDGTFARPSIGGVYCPLCGCWNWAKDHPERNAEGFIIPVSMHPRSPINCRWCNANLMGGKKTQQQIMNQLMEIM